MNPKALSPQLVADLAMASVEMAAALPNLKGKKRHRLAAKDLAKKMDALITFPPTPLGILAELLDGPLLALCGGFIEDAFRRRKINRAAKRAKKGKS